MNDFVYSYPTKVYFGVGAAAKHLPGELAKAGKTVLLAYGGGSVKRNGVYDEICGILEAAGKTVVDFPGVMPNPTYAKVQEGAALCRERGVDPAGRTEEETALAGIDALAAFIKEIGLPTTFTEMGITDESVLRATADTCNLTAGCCKKFDREEIFQLLKECL